MEPEPISVAELVLRRAQEGSLLPRHQAGASPQRLLTTLLGEHWLDNPHALPLSAIIDLLAEFGITETSTRATTSRLVKRRVLDTERTGRQAYLRLTDVGREDIRHKTAAILHFGHAGQNWDGQWTLAAFSIPQEQRQLRHQVRSYLRWLSFAPLFDGLWVSPHANPASLEEVFHAAGVHNVSVFRGVEAGGMSPLTAWDLDRVVTAYDTFLATHRDLLDRVTSGDVTPSAALSARVKVFESWREFLGLDPDLPVKLLPDDWPRAEARAMFAALYDELGPLAELRFRQIVAAHDPDLAEHARHHSSADWAEVDM
jgi:phenylacetic acid degradation operon negative regulatory protein